MRKTSHDGGDSTSITSGVENEVKKSIMKPKKSSLKRKAPNFSQESDDTVIEPLLQRDKDKSEPQSAKYFGTGKTDSLQNKEIDKAKTTTTGFCGTTESLLSFKDSDSPKTTSGVVAPLHNYMNTNVFNTHDNAKANITTKSQILVELDSSKQSSYSPSPLIFTTAKIHTDAKTKQMEPVHVTPVPILSTIEVNMSKGGNITTNQKKISNGSSVINPIYSPTPLSKGKEEKVTLSSFSSVLSPTMSKDVFGNTVTVTSATKLGNITTAQSSSMKITLPSIASSSLSMKSNTKDKQGDTKDDKKEQTLPQNMQPQSKAFNLDSSKNNVVKTIIPSSEKATDISKSAKTNVGDKSQIQKFDADDKTSVNMSSYDPQHLTSNNKTPTSQNVAEISNPANKISTSVGNKQLQRQKTTTEETNNIKSNVEPKIEHSENSSAKTPSSSHSKLMESISIKDGKVPNISAKNTQSLITKSSINSISKMTPISTTTKPTVASVASLNTVTTSNVANKPSTTNTVPNAKKTDISPTTTSTALPNVNKITNASSVSSTNITKSPAANIAKTSTGSSIVTTNCPEVTTQQTQPQASVSKTLPEKTSMGNSGIAKTTASVSSDKNNVVVKSPSGVEKPFGTTLSQPLPKPTSKTTATKTPVTTSAKTTLASSITSAATKPSSSSQITSSTPPLTSGSVAAVKTAAVTTSIPKALSGTVSSKSQNTTSQQESGNKQAIQTATNATTKTSSVVTPGKLSTVNSSAPVSITAGVKSPNTNSSQIVGVSKPSLTSIPKTEPVTTLSKTSAGSSNTIVTATAIKSPKDSSTVTINTKESAAPLKKPAAAKTSVATKSPPASSANKSIVGTTTKISSDASSVSTSSTKKLGAVLAKTGSVTTSTKIPSVSTITKAPDITSTSSTTKSAAAIKPATTSATQVSANKSVGLAGSSVPSFTPAPKPSDSDKKGGSKSSDNNKDGKVSKA